jgi:lysophospholipase L1-like esterase
MNEPAPNKPNNDNTPVDGPRGYAPLPKRRKASLRARLIRLLLLPSLSLLVAFLFGELLVRLVMPQPMTGVMHSADPDFGFWNKADLRDKQFQNDVGTPPYRVTTNERGLRMDRSVVAPKPDDLRRVLVMGDSFVFGVGVNNSHTFPARLEQRLNKTAGEALPRFEVVNAGCPGWGTENALAFYRKVGVELDPDLVVVCFYRNDLKDNMRRLVYQLRDGVLSHEPDTRYGRVKRLVDRLPGYRFLAERSHLVNLFRRVVSQWLTQPHRERRLPPSVRDVENPSPTPSPTPPIVIEYVENPIPGGPEIPAYLAGQTRVFAALVEGFLETAARDGVPVLLVLLPGLHDCYPEPARDYTAVQTAARYWNERGAPRAIDLRPLFLEKENIEAFFLPSDGHYSVEGNALVAELLEPIVRETLEGARMKTKEGKQP